MPYLSSPSEKVEALNKARGEKPASDIETNQLRVQPGFETYCNPFIRTRGIIPDNRTIH